VFFIYVWYHYNNNMGINKFTPIQKAVPYTVLQQGTTRRSHEVELRNRMECTIEDYLCEEMFHHILSFLSPKDLCCVSCVSFVWNLRVEEYKCFWSHLWKRVYVHLGGGTLEKNNSCKWDWRNETIKLMRCNNDIDFFKYALEIGDAQVLRNIKSAGTKITPVVLQPSNMDGTLFEWQRDWLACRMILKCGFIFVFKAEELTRVIEIEAESHVKEITFRPRFLFSLTTCKEVHKFQALNQLERSKWVQAINQALPPKKRIVE